MAYRDYGSPGIDRLAATYRPCNYPRSIATVSTQAYLANPNKESVLDMLRTMYSAATVAALTAVALLPALAVRQHAAQHAKKPTPPAPDPVANVKQQNQFVTVDEFTKQALPQHTPVSIEGYMVVGFRTSDGSEMLDVVDSVDHVLSPTDADNFARGGAKGMLPARMALKHPSMGWSVKGMERFVMYTGEGHAQKPLHDTVAKVRVTGFAAGKAVIRPITKVEYADENGDWKTL